MSASALQCPAPHRFRGLYRNYSLYGITLRSEIPLMGAVATAHRAANTTLRLEAPGAFDDLASHPGLREKSADWYHRVQLADGSDFLRWPDLFDFLISADGRLISCVDHESATLESLQTYLLGHALSYALVHQGLEPLHATTVVVNGTGLALLGPSGQGKSTMAAAFMAAGCPLLTDDLLVLRTQDRSVIAYPGPPRIKMFPDALDRLLPELIPSGQMNPLTEKVVVPLTSTYACNEPVPMGAFVVIDGGDRCSFAMTPVPGQQAFADILAASFNKKLLSRDRLQRQFAAFTAWASLVPVFRLSYPWRHSELERTRDRIVDVMCSEAVA